MADSTPEASEDDKAKSDPKTDKLFSKFLSEVRQRSLLTVLMHFAALYPNILVHYINIVYSIL